MIEVALAMAIIAIGISSILVLFPVGINASKSAIADNNLADIAEYIFGYYKTAKLHDFYSNSSTTTMSTLHGALNGAQQFGYERCDLEYQPYYRYQSADPHQQ